MIGTGRAARYDVTIKHQRMDPVSYGFTYHMDQWLIDLDDVPVLPRPLRRLAGFRAADHLGDPRLALRVNVENFLRANGIDLDGGPIRTLANPRVLGYAFNPLSLHWCHHADGSLACVIAEVHNTYGQRHAYLVHPDAAGRADVDKQFYVSPFYDVSGAYRMSVPEPADALAITLTLHRQGERPFVAAVRGSRRPGSVGLLHALRTPLASRAVMFAIKRHGSALYLKGLRPAHRPEQNRQPGVQMPASAVQELPRPVEPAVPVAAELDPADVLRWPDVVAQPHRPIRAAVARVLFTRAVAKLAVRIELPDGHVLGAGGTDAPTMRLLRPEAFYQRLGATGLIGFGESYMAGDWMAGGRRPVAVADESSGNLEFAADGEFPAGPQDDLATVLTEFAEQMGTLIPPWLQRLRQAAVLRAPGAQDNTVPGSRRNISHHYDLSNELFSAFLDPSMSYSSALFDADPVASRESLRDAQHRKIDRLLDVTGVTAGSRVLEIGTGWGELAILAADRGATVTTVTLSQEQAELARKRIENAGHTDAVTVELQDYRETTGSYDAVLSVEMIEAVGANHWNEYFTLLHDRLAPGGRIGLQAITMPHDRMLASMNTYTWILKYIFPGGQIASVQAVRNHAAQAGLRVTGNFAFGLHYAETLRRWRARFEAQSATVDRLGFDLVFRRMWSLYLGYSEAGFRSGYLDVNQFVLTKDAS